MRDGERLALGSAQAVENVGTQGSVSRQELTELLSRDSRLGGELCDLPTAASTPKELRHIAQGCERSELPWVREIRLLRTPTGFRHPSFSNDATLSG